MAETEIVGTDVAAEKREEEKPETYDDIMEEEVEELPKEEIVKDGVDFFLEKLPSGVSVFAETFRRADKNDDGHLSREEFLDYFDDEGISVDELHKLFNRIDLDKNENISIDELMKFFLEDFDAYEDLYVTLEKMNGLVHGALLRTSEVYENKQFFEQFRIRLYLKEAAKHFSVLTKPLVDAVTHLEHKGDVFEEDEEIVPDIRQEENPLAIEDLKYQIERLRAYITKMDQSIFGNLHMNVLDSVEEVEADFHSKESEDACVLVLRKLDIDEQVLDAFRKTLFGYVRTTKADSNCEHVYVKKVDENAFYLYELWNSMQSYHDHFSSPGYRSFKKILIDLLSSPEQVVEMPVPKGWFPAMEGDMEYI